MTGEAVSPPLDIQRRPAGDGSRLGEHLDPLVRRVLAQRGITAPDQVDLSIQNMLPPDGMLGLDAAVDLLVGELDRQGRVLIVSDFDADGATSCALGVLALRSMGFSHVDYIVPNRFEYGYGLTPEIVALAANRSPDLIITVDNGISSLAGVEAAQRSGIRVLITDHHLPGARIPAADAIVNPNQPGCAFPSKSIAGVGVIFYLMLALRARLRQQDRFGKSGMPEPNLAELLDLVALGTVADVVVLDRNNRILVSEGLRRIRAGRCRAGISAIIRISGRRQERLVASDLGFAVGPRLNAAGRLDDMSLGIECLLTESTAAAHGMALQLDSLNSDRKQIETTMRDQAFQILEKMALKEDSMPAGLCVYDPSWHQGVIGILASRIKDRYHRPVIAFADAGGPQDEPLQLKGSARSIKGFHVRDALEAIASSSPGLLSKFGGHAMAAGLSIERDRLAEFAGAFEHVAARQLGEDELRARIISDGALQERDLGLDSAEALAQAGPWGQGFPEPLFDGLFRVRDLRVVGERHLKLQVSLQDSERCVDAIIFNADPASMPTVGSVLQLAFRLEVNEFRDNRRLQLVVEAYGAAG